MTLTVTDDDGATNAKTTNVTVTTPAPVALVSDTFGRTVTNGFGPAETGGTWTIAGGNTNFSVNDGTGKIRIPTAGSTLTAALGQVTSADVDITLQMALDKPATGGGLYVSVSARKVGNSEYRVSPRFTSTGGVQVQLIKVVSGTSTVLQTTTLSSFGYVAGEQVSLRFKVVGTSTVSLQSKIWKSSTTEPAAWQTTATDANAPLTTAGTLQFIAYMSGSSTNAPVVVSYDNLKVFARDAVTLSDRAGPRQSAQDSEGRLSGVTHSRRVERRRVGGGSRATAHPFRRRPGAPRLLNSTIECQVQEEST